MIDHLDPVGAADPDAIARLTGLSSGARSLVDVAAVLGPSFLLHDAAEVVGLPAGQLLAGVREALDAGLLVTTPRALAFGDETVHRTVYGDIPQSVRQALHRQIGELVLARGGPATCAATHLLIGAQPGDQVGLDGLDRAAREVHASAPQWAAELALRALELTEPADPARHPRTAAAVEELVAAGRVGEARLLADVGLADRDASGAPTARLRLAVAWMLYMQGRPAEAIDSAEAVLAEPGLPGPLTDAAQLNRLLGLMAQDDRPQVRERVEAILAGDDGSGGDATLVGALFTLSALCRRQGRMAESLAFLRAAAKREDGRRCDFRHPYVRLALASGLTAAGEFDAADAEIAAASEVIGQNADTLWTAAPPIARACVHLAAGRLEAAAAGAEVGLGIAAGLETPIFVPAANGVLAAVALLRGDLAAAAGRLADEGAASPGRSVLWGSAFLGWVEIQITAAVDGVGGVDEGVYDEIADDKRLLLDEPAAAAWLVRTALAVDCGARAETVVRQITELAESNRGIDSLAASAAHARGVLDRDPALLEQAAVSHRNPWASASAWEDAGMALADRGDGCGARPALERAFAIYEQMGADRDLARVRARQRALGVRRSHWTHRQHPVSGLPSLTETELAVAHLVAEGLTNVQVAHRMFLSRHTVDFHLRQIFRKLGIDSRITLTRIVLTQSEPMPVAVAVAVAGGAT